MKATLDALPAEIPAGRAGLSAAELLLERPEPPVDALSAYLDGLLTQGHIDLLGGGLFGPQGEKTLADNARLLQISAATAALSGEQRHAALARSTADYILRDLRAPSGGYWHSEAPSEFGEFYAWDPVELQTLLGPEAAPLLAHAQLSDSGQLQATDPDLLLDAGTRSALIRLFGARLERLPPPTDARVLAADNGLLLRALSVSGALLGESAHLSAAEDLAQILTTTELDTQGQPLAGPSFTAAGLLSLNEALPDPRWLLAAQALAPKLRAGLSEPPPPQDGALPSAWGEAVIVLHRLSLLGAPGSQAELSSLLGPGLPALQTDALACGAMSRAVLELQRPAVEVVIASDKEDPTLPFWIAAFHTTWRPGVRLAVTRQEPELAQFSALSGKLPGPNGPRAYVCVGASCGLPSSTLEGFIQALEPLSAIP